MRNTLFILLLCLIAIAFGMYLFFHSPGSLTGKPTDTDQTATVATAPTGEVAVMFTSIETGANAQEVTERKNVAARDPESFKRLWDMVHGGAEMAMPPVDFSKEYVIGVFAGQQPSGGHSVQVTGVVDSGGTRTITVTLSAPGEGCVVTDALTSPYELIRVPESGNYLEAVDIAGENPC